ncbi:RdRp [Hubei virga-like virus 18]|uniref:RdRp n=1 Tax=Hubei virga-like virus 18 TaxID=1923333 RepID=UPI000909BCC1|nr:RdRp [Hubei virga-like virus 18]APG77621.1 RdRp [Hubei virga-like virus 18]
METTIDKSDFVAGIDTIFGSVVSGNNRDQILLNFLNAKTDNVLKQVFADHYKQLYDSYKTSKRFSKEVKITPTLTTDEKKQLTDAYPGLKIQFTSEDKNAHAYAKASRVLEFYNILFQRIRIAEDDNVKALMDTNCWDAFVKDCGGDPTALLKPGTKYLHVCAPNIGHDSYDSVRYTHRITSLINRSTSDREYHHKAKQLLADIQDNRTTNSLCSNKGQCCPIRAPFVMFVHSIYDMTLTDIADTMDAANALIGYASIIYSDEILINTSGTLKPLNVWWKYSNLLTDMQWNPEIVLNHTEGTITFGFNDDDGFNYEHSLANYKSFFTTSRFCSSKGVYYSLELQENRDGIQFIRFTKELKPSSRGVTHTINLRSLEDKYLISMYDVAPDYAPVRVKPNAYRSVITPWLASNHSRLIPYRFLAERDPVDKTINYLSSVKANLKPNECLNYLRNYCTRSIHNGSVMDQRLNLDETQIKLLSNALYLNVYDSNYRSGKIVQQAVNDLDIARNFSYFNYRRIFGITDYLNISENWCTRNIRKFSLYINTNDTAQARICRTAICSLRYVVAAGVFVWTVKKIYRLISRYPTPASRQDYGLFANAFFDATQSITTKLRACIQPVLYHDRVRVPVCRALSRFLPPPSPWWSSSKNLSRHLIDYLTRCNRELFLKRIILTPVQCILRYLPLRPSYGWHRSPLSLSLPISCGFSIFVANFGYQFTRHATMPLLMESTSHLINTRDMIQVPVTKYTYVEKKISHLGIDYSMFVPAEFSDDERTTFAKSMIKSIYNVDIDSQDLTPVIRSRLENRNAKTPEQLDRDRFGVATAVPEFNEIKSRLFPREVTGALPKLLSLFESVPDLAPTADDVILEIGAAPGSWTDHLLEQKFSRYVVVSPRGSPHLPLSSTVRDKLSSTPNVTLVEKPIQEYVTELRFHKIYSDAAGPVLDYNTQSINHDSLFLDILKFSSDHLVEGGSLLMKMFDLTPTLKKSLDDLKSSFRSVRLIKPEHSKPLNPECYLVASGFKVENIEFEVEDDYSRILAQQTKNLAAFVDEYNKLKPTDNYVEIPVAADGNCCFSAATLNRVHDIDHLKKTIGPLLIARNPDASDLVDELRPGMWGGSAFLQAFGDYCDIKYIVHDANGLYTFGATSTRIIHLKRHNNHYSILKDVHFGTSDPFSVNSFPPFRFSDVSQKLSKYINFGGSTSNYIYSDNMDLFCSEHRECRNNCFGRILSNKENKIGLLFFIEKHNGQLDVGSLNEHLQLHDLNLRLHALYLPDHYVVSTHHGYSEVTGDLFSTLDKHFASCSCGRLNFESDIMRSERGIVYYCKKATFDSYRSGGAGDLIVELIDQCAHSLPSKLSYKPGHLIVPITVTETQRLSHHPSHDDIVSTLQQNYDNSICDIVIKTPVVDPKFVAVAISSVYPKAQLHYDNLTGGKLRLLKAPLIETGIPSIIINTMMERRNLWEHTINFTKKTLERYHSDMVTAHKTGRPLFCKDTAFHLYDVEKDKVLMGTGINREDVRWGWDGAELISFDSLTTSGVQQATRSPYVSFNKHSVLLQAYHHYQRTKGVDIEGINILCKFFPILGIPGGGKTEYILRQCKESVSPTLILTVSKAAKDDVQTRADRMGLDHNITICTFDSFMINYERRHSGVEYKDIWFDEARLTHAGDWLWAACLTRCENMYIVGDVAQIPYCERTDYNPRYASPNIFTVPSHNLSISHRCPQDIVQWMRISRDNSNKPFYDFPISTTSKVVHSVEAHAIGNIAAVPVVNNAQYLVYTQEELRSMIDAGFTNCRTVHQYQGNQNAHIILVRLQVKDAIPVFKSMAHMLVAFTRHTTRFDYYTCCPTDKDLIHKNVVTIKKFSDNDVKARAGGVDFRPSIEIEMPRTQQPYLYPRIVRDLNDRYGFGAVIPMQIRRVNPIVDTLPYQTLSFDPLVGYQHILREYNDLLYRVPSGIDNISDHDIYTISDKQFFGDYSLIPSASRTKDKIYAQPRIPTSSRLRNPIDQYQIVKAYCERNGAVPQIRGNVDSLDMADMLLNTVVSLLDPHLLELCRTNPIVANNNSITTWLARQPTAVRNQIASDPDIIDDKDLTRYFFTIKGNAKPDLDANPHARYKSAQTIAYQDKSINAIFCPIMADFTDRLVAMLNPNIVLFNRLSNADYVSLVNAICPYERFRTLTRFFEIDFSKFDKSQDQTALEFECKLMSMLGVSYEYVSRWYHMHVRTTLVDIGNKFSANIEYQRKSGDAGTWVLNTVFQMAVVINAMRLESEILAGRCFATFSGDDSLVFIDDLLPINVDHVSSTCANIFNLEVKLLNFKTPYFCSKFFLPTPQGVLFVPDVVKTLVKLGRRDLISIEHAKEYFISFNDNNAPLTDAYLWPTISRCIADRYALGGDHSILIHAIATIAADEEKFLSLWDFSGTVDSPNRPSLEI